MKKVVKRHLTVRKVSIILVVLVTAGALVFATALLYNNVSLANEKSFEKKLDASLSKTQQWVEQHTDDILYKKNVAFLTMLRYCDNVKPNPVFNNIVQSFLDTPVRNYTVCWKR